MKENSDRDETNTKSASSSSPLFVRMQRVYHFDVKLVNSITYTVGIGRIYDCNGTWNQERKMKIVSRMRLNTIASNWLVYTTLHIVDQRSKHKKKYSSNFNILKRFGLVSTGEHALYRSLLLFRFILLYLSRHFHHSKVNCICVCIHLFWVFLCLLSSISPCTFLGSDFPLPKWLWWIIYQVIVLEAFIQGNVTQNMRVSLQIAYFFIWPMSFMHSLYHFITISFGVNSFLRFICCCSELFVFQCYLFLSLFGTCS